VRATRRSGRLQFGAMRAFQNGTRRRVLERFAGCKFAGARWHNAGERGARSEAGSVRRDVVAAAQIFTCSAPCFSRSVSCQALQRAVMALVQAPRALDRQHIKSISSSAIQSVRMARSAPT